MKTNDVIFKDQQLNKEESKSLVSNIINKQIDYIQMEQLSKWERNHELLKDEAENKVKKLRSMQKELHALIEQLAKDEDDKLDIALHFDIKSSTSSVQTHNIFVVN